MNIETYNNSGHVRRLIKIFCDPVLIYTTLIMMAVMYHYRSSLTFVYGIATMFIGAFVFRVFDFIAKHKLIGSAAYIALFAGFMAAADFCIDTGIQEYPISFGIWFLTPQDSLEYSSWYTLAMYLIFMIFMASVIYYFTRVRYRIFMNFLIFIIPFAIYGKEYEKMPTLFIILLAAGYIVIMIKFRQLSENEKTVIVDQNRIWKSAAVYVVVFSTIAAVVPKPYIKADRSQLDALISADAFTDRLVEMLNVFRDTTSNETFRNATSEDIRYFASSPGPVRLKTQTYTAYNYEDDSWSVSDNDRYFNFTTNDRKIILEKPGQLLEAIGNAVQGNAYFRYKYDLPDLKAENIHIPAERVLRLYSTGTSGQFAPVPTQLYSFDCVSYHGEIALLESGAVYSVDGRFSGNENFNLTYTYAEEFFFNEENKKIADYMSNILYEDYYDLILQCKDFYKDENNEEYLMFEAHEAACESFEQYLDYGNNTRIAELASELTEGLISDYDKAKAIEAYFSYDDFVYDLEYRKSKGDNVEDFIFESKTGVCYEYATAMVLLSRAAGIPARFAEGYSLSEQYNNSRLGTNYVIKTKDAHGFPELYIRGVGWVSFEPTISDNSYESDNKSDVARSLSTMGIFIFVVALIFLIAVKLYPVVSNKIFLLRIRNEVPEKSVILIMRRMCRLCEISDVLTSHEAVDEIYKKTGVNSESFADIFDETVYGEVMASDKDKNDAMDLYVKLYEQLRANKKRQKNKGKDNL